MARVVLINPPLMDLRDRDLGFKENLGHIGLAYIAAALLERGHEVRVVDAPKLGLGLGDVARVVRDFGPLVAGLTASTYQINEAAATARAIKAAVPGLRTVIGGYHAGGAPERTLDEFGDFDYLVEGEGEFVMAGLVEALETGTEPPPLPGLWRRADGRPSPGPAPQRILDLDSLPFPAFQLFPHRLFTGMYSWRTRTRVTSLATSRGCPFRCNFCFRAVGLQYVARSPESVLDEIDRDIRDFRIRELIFTDETFTLDRDRTVRILEGMLGRGHQRLLSWVCQSRVDCVDAELVTLMKKAGCRVVSYGVESGNQSILDSIGKAITLEQAAEAVRLTRNAGMKSHTAYIIGHPGEDRAAIRDTVDFAVKADSDWASFAILVPFPGAEVTRMAEQGQGGLRLLTRDWTQYGKQVGYALEHENTGRAELERMQRTGYKRFYLRPSKFLNLFSVVNLRSIPIYLWHNLMIRLGRRKP